MKMRLKNLRQGSILAERLVFCGTGSEGFKALAGVGYRLELLLPLLRRNWGRLPSRALPCLAAIAASGDYVSRSTVVL